MSIVLTELVKRYAGEPVVDHVSLDVQDGEFFVLLGESGSGKSTILRMIAGLAHPDEGTIVLHGRDVTSLSPQERNTGFVFQNYSLFRHMTVAENVEFSLSVRKVPRADRAAKRDELLALVGLAGFARRYPRQLSGGQQQRVAVARALAFSPSVLLLDEPFGALDVKIRGQLRRALRQIQKSLNITTILVTHDQEEAFELADRIGVIERGHLLEVGSPVELYRSPQSELVAGFIGEANLVGTSSTAGKIRIGGLEITVPEDAGARESDGSWAVLFRPEDLTLAADEKGVGGAALGEGIVEEVRERGPSRRIVVRLDPPAGVWPLKREYGEQGLALVVAHPSEPDAPAAPAVGEKVEVRARGYHLLPRLAWRLLLVADGSVETAHAAGICERVARAAGARLTIVGSPGNDTAAPISKLRESLPSADVQLSIADGDLAERVLAELARMRYDIVFLPGDREGQGQGAGGRGRRGKDGDRVDSRRIVAGSPSPALVAGGDPREMGRVLLCTAGGEPGKIDILLGAQVARRLGAAVTLLYVERDASRAAAPSGEAVGETTAVRRARAWIERHLEQGLRTLRGQGVSAETRIRYGEPLREILAEAAEGDYGLIIAGAHVERTYFHAPERDLTMNLIDRSDRPVLIVKGTLDR
ncbi:MAG TPA: ATP-binding cassette domain-containing protein [Thermoanaerobaculia bacterium]